MIFSEWDDIVNFPVYQQRLKVALVHARTRPAKFWFFHPFSFGAKKGALLLLGEVDPKLLAQVEKQAGRAKGRGRCSVNPDNQLVLQLSAGNVDEDKLKLALRQANTNLTGVISPDPAAEETEPDPEEALAQITLRRKEILARVDALKTRAEVDPGAMRPIHQALAALGQAWARDPFSTAESLDAIDAQLSLFERTGLHPHHERKFQQMAIEKNEILMVRCANVESLEYQGRKGCCPKPVTCKAKTAKFGPNAGLVVDPTHPAQRQAWKEALLAAGSRAAQLEIAASRETALKEWGTFKQEQLGKTGTPYTVDSATGVLHYFGDKVHGDVDLHGVFALPRSGSEAGPRRVDHGSGDSKGAAEGPASVRRVEMNQQLNPDGKPTQDPIQHGGEVDSAKHRNNPAPPIIAFTPQGRVVLKDLAAVKKFYLAQGLGWPPA
jgi:hypothetical protein